MPFSHYIWFSVTAKGKGRCVCACVSRAQEPFNLAHSLGIYDEGQWKVNV